MRQMSYSVCRFWAYDESKKLLGANGPNAPAYKLALAGTMGKSSKKTKKKINQVSVRGLELKRRIDCLS